MIYLSGAETKLLETIVIVSLGSVLYLVSTLWNKI